MGFKTAISIFEGDMKRRVIRISRCGAISRRHQHKEFADSQRQSAGVTDIDELGFGDMLTFAAMAKVALLNMGLDTDYVGFLLEEIGPGKTQYKAFVFYCLMYCADFMGSGA